MYTYIYVSFICFGPYLRIRFFHLFFIFLHFFLFGRPCLLCSRTRSVSLYLILPLIISPLLFFFLCFKLWPHNWYLSRMKNQDGHWVYCWCRLVERTVQCENNNNSPVGQLKKYSNNVIFSFRYTAVVDYSSSLFYERITLAAMLSVPLEILWSMHLSLI